MHDVSRNPKDEASPIAGPIVGMSDFPLSPGTILVVDDNRDAADTTVAVLEVIGFSAIAAYSAQDGLDRLDEHSDICLVVSDIRMPGVDGFDFIRVIKHRFPALPALLTTGLPITEEDVVPRGALIVQKPFAIDELKQAIEAQLRTSQNTCAGSP